MKLENIADVQTGLVLARKRATARDKHPAKYRLLTLKSFQPGGWLNKSELDFFLSIIPLEEKYLTKKGDVIIRLTTPYTAITIENEEGLVIPSNFAIIRLRDSNFIPGYIALHLNSKRIEKEFSQFAISTTIPLIKTGHLRNVAIGKKPIETQRKIVELNKLQQKEEMLLNNLLEQKKKLAETSINKIITEG